ncbi:MAG: PIN domain-containing protein [Rhodomicrobium sp.]
MVQHPVGDPGAGEPIDPADISLQAQIDSARDLLRAGQSRTALRMFKRLAATHWENASTRARFRLLTNQGAAEYNLGNLSDAAELFLQAEPFGGGEPLGRSNVVLALILRDEVKEARRRADAILKDDPGNAFVAPLRVIAAFDEEGVEDPFSILPSTHAGNVEVIAAAARWHRHRGHASECLRLFERAYALNPAIDHIRAELAVALLEPIVSGGYVRFTAGLNGDDRNNFDRAVQLLSSLWNDAKATETAGGHIVTALNLVTALRFAARTDDAEKVLNEALLVAPDDQQLKLHRIQMRLLANEPEKALAELDGFPESVRADSEMLSLRAEACMAARRFDEAVEAFDALGSSPEVKYRSVLQLDRVRALWLGGHEPEATAAAEALVSGQPAEPASYVALSFVRRRAGDKSGAREAALKALELASASDRLCVIFIAEELYGAEEWDSVADLLAPITAPTQESDLLRRRLSSLIFADRRKEVMCLLRELAPEVKAQPYYLRCAAMFYARVGDFTPARQNCEDYLRLRPNDLYMRLKLLEIVERLNDQSARDAFLDGCMAAYDDAEPALRMELARVLDFHGRPEEAFAIAYATLRRYWHEPEAHLGYSGLFFGGQGAHRIIREIDCIGPDTAFTIAAEESGRPPSVFVIEPLYHPLNPLLGELAPDTALAKRVMGMRVGDRVKVHDHPGADEREITEIKHKYLYLFHRSLQEFNTLFPSERGLFGMPIPPDAPEKGMAKIHDVARQRRDRVDRLFDVYKSHPIPLAMVARLAGDEPIDAWAGLMEAGVPFDVCVGSEAERNEALQLLRPRPPLILDPLTLWIAGCFGVLNVLADTYGPLGLTSSAISMLERCQEERAHAARYEGGSMTAGDRDGEIVFSKYSQEQSQASFDLAERILRLAKSDRAIILQAIPDQDCSRTVRQLVSHMDPSVADVIAAASGSRRVFLCEDHRLRWLAGEASKVKGVWLQPALLVACESGHFPRLDYNKVIASLALAGHHFTSIDHEVLLQAGRSNNWCPEGQFTRLVKLLGSSTIEVQSMLVVASAFLRALWSNPDSRPKREVLTLTLLDGITSGREQMAPHLLNALLRSGRPPKTKPLDTHLRIRAAFRNCICKWAKDNNIALPEAA